MNNPTTSQNTKHANCLCGKVKFTITNPDTSIHACHCGMCRTWGGGPFLTVDCSQAEVTMEGTDHINRYNSSQWAERGFCNKCGTHLFYHLKSKNAYMLPAGLFDNIEEFDFNQQIFIDKKPPNYDFANKTENLTEEELFKNFS